MSCWKLANPLVTLPGLLREPSEPAPVCIRTLYNKLTLTHAFDEQRLDESLQQKQAEFDGRPSRIAVSGQSYVARVMASLPSQTRGSGRGRVRPGPRRRLFEASTSSRLGIGRIFTQLRRRAKASMLQVKCFLLPPSTASRALQLLVLRILLGPTQRPKRLPPRPSRSADWLPHLLHLEIALDTAIVRPMGFSSGHSITPIIVAPG